MKKIIQTLFLLLFAGSSYLSWGQCIDSTLIDPNNGCTEEYVPVCGCDGVTYGNSCEATAAGVLNFTQGECIDNIIVFEDQSICQYESISSLQVYPQGGFFSFDFDLLNSGEYEVVYTYPDSLSGIPYTKTAIVTVLEAPQTPVIYHDADADVFVINNYMSGNGYTWNFEGGFLNLEFADSQYLSKYTLDMVINSVSYSGDLSVQAISNSGCAARPSNVIDIVASEVQCYSQEEIEMPEDLPTILDPVCACDQQTYANKDVALIDGLVSFSYGVCDSIDQMYVTADIVYPTVDSLFAGAIDITVSGGAEPYFYTWTKYGEEISLSEDIFGIDTGLYTVEIVDSLMNTVTRQFYVPLSAPSLFRFDYNVIHHGMIAYNAGIDVTVYGGTAPYTYHWSTGATTQDLDTVGFGCYVLFVTDANGVTIDDSICIENPYFEPLFFELNVTNPTSATSFDGAIDLVLHGGVSPFSYVWIFPNDSIEVLDMQDLDGIGPGEYEVLVTDATGGTMGQTVVLTVASGMSINYSITNPTEDDMFGGAIDITVTGGSEPYFYSWYKYGDSIAFTEDIYGIDTGYYRVDVIDSVGSQVSEWIYVVFDSVQYRPLTLTYEVTNATYDNIFDGAIDITVTGGSAPYFYTWYKYGETIANTEDISRLDTGYYEIHVYDTVGNYVSDVIYIAFDSLTNSFSISGMVTANGSPASESVVLLIRMNRNNRYPMEAFAVGDSAYFNFSGIAEGNYILYAVPNPGVNPEFLPTYYALADHWRDAHTFELNGSVYGLEVELLEIRNPGNGHGNGNGRIRGNIALEDTMLINTGMYAEPWFGSTKSASELVSLANLPVYLYQDGEIVAWTLTDANGDYVFDNLAEANYSVNAQYPGISEATQTVTLDADNMIADNLSFTLSAGELDATVITETKEIVLVSPNPCTQAISINCEVKGAFELTVIDVIGNEVLTETSSLTDINVEALPAGMYFGTLTTADGVKTFTFVKR